MVSPVFIQIRTAVGAVVLGAALLGLLWFVADVFQRAGSATGLGTGGCPRCGGTGRKLGPPQEIWVPCPCCAGSGRR